MLTMTNKFAFCLAGLVLLTACGSSAVDERYDSAESATSQPTSTTKTEPAKAAYSGHDLTLIPDAQADEWASELDDLARRVTREAATEPRKTGYWNNKKAGTYFCIVCGLPLYDANTKFDSGTGWPSFYKSVNSDHIGTTVDYHLTYPRTEVHCQRCNSHLGHIFNDAPEQPGGKRHCINSVALQFVAEGETWPERSLPKTEQKDQ